jgi:hypothetical protein
MEPEGSLPNSQVPANCLYPEPARTSPCPTSYFLKINFNIILPSMHPPPATRATFLNLLDFITGTILGEYRSFSSSLCTFLHSPSSRPSYDQIFYSTPYCHSPPTFFPLCERPSFTPTQIWQNYCSVYHNI